MGKKIVIVRGPLPCPSRYCADEVDVLITNEDGDVAEALKRYLEVQEPALARYHIMDVKTDAEFASALTTVGGRNMWDLLTSVARAAFHLAEPHGPISEWPVVRGDKYGKSSEIQ